MFYETKNDDHGLPYNPFKSCTVPRVIGWVSTRSADGIDNVAPYSQFTNLTFDPPYVLFSANQNVVGDRKRTVENIEKTGVFAYNMVSKDLSEAMNRSSIFEIPKEYKDKFDYAGVTKKECNLIDVAMVDESPVKYECEYVQTIRLPGKDTLNTIDIIIGKVIGIHIKDEFILPDGKVDILGIKPVARLGYYDFTVVENSFEMKAPIVEDPELQALVDKGLAGEVK